ncbi:MAG: class I SAM-dependent methyltransferase [Bacteroidales bacterium]|nr:class I SAM-dependent methyltransferase [Bacteroidales bacterium]
MKKNTKSTMQICKNLDMSGKVSVFVPTSEETAILEKLNGADEYSKLSEMSVEERQFLNGLILRNKPKKLLELGVSSGGSSVIMLNAIKELSDTKLYSIEYLPYWYKNKNKKVGFVVENYPVLKNQWKLFTGGLALNFMDEIGSDIDFCLIDTMHTNPGEILDFLMVLPYLKDGAIVVFHDTNLQTAGKMFQWHFTNNLLMSSIVGNKILQGNFDAKTAWSKVAFPNIGVVEISQETRQHLYSIFNLLTLQWYYLPSETEQLAMLKFFEKHYSLYFVNYLEQVFDYHNKNFHKHHGIRHKLKETAKKIPFAWTVMDKLYGSQSNK